MANILWTVGLSLLSVLAVIKFQAGIYDAAMAYVIIALFLFVSVILIKHRNSKRIKLDSDTEQSDISLTEEILEKDLNGKNNSISEANSN